MKKIKARTGCSWFCFHESLCYASCCLFCMYELLFFIFELCLYSHTPSERCTVYQMRINQNYKKNIILTFFNINISVDHWMKSQDLQFFSIFICIFIAMLQLLSGTPWCKLVRHLGVVSFKRALGNEISGKCSYWVNCRSTLQWEGFWAMQTIIMIIAEHILTL